MLSSSRCASESLRVNRVTPAEYQAGIWTWVVSCGRNPVTRDMRSSRRTLTTCPETKQSDHTQIYQTFTFEKPSKFEGVICTSFFIHQVAFYVIHMVVPLCNRVMWLVLQSDLFGYAVTYLAPHKHLDRVCTSKHIIYYVSHLISVNRHHIPRGLVTGVIIVISATDKSLPRWVICKSDRERERSLALKMKH